jgi:uncharacterized protein (TIRG00374 family)
MQRVVVGFLGALVAFGAFLLVFDVGAMWATLQGADLGLFLLGVVAVALAVACWAESMRRVHLAAGGSATPGTMFTSYSVGMFAKQVLPMGNAGGPAIMAYAIDRESDLDFERSLAVVTVGDFLGLCASLLLALVGIAYVVLTVPPTRLVQAALVGVALFAVVLVSVAVLLVFRRRTLRYLVLGVARICRDTVGRLSDRLAAALTREAVDASTRRYFETFDAAAGDRRSMAVAAALALCGWTLFAVPLYTSAAAVGAPMAFGLVLFVVPVGGLATAIPLPGGLGGVEFAVAGMVLALTTADPAVVGAMVLLYRLCVYWFVVFLGGVGLAMTAASVRSVAAEAMADPDLTEHLES